MTKERLILIQDQIRAREKYQHDKQHEDVEYAPGDTVIYWRAHSAGDMGHHLQSFWTGPYVVTQKQGPLNYWIKDPIYDAKVRGPISLLDACPLCLKPTCKGEC